MQIFNTNKVTQSGFYNMQARDYHADPCPAPSLSSSLARVLVNNSPLHAWTGHPRLNPDFEEKSTNRLDAGKLAHAILLGTEQDEIEIHDVPDWRGGRAEIKAKALAIGKTAVKQTEYDEIKKVVASALKQMETIQDFPPCLFKEGIRYRELTACLNYEGIWLRCRIDVIGITDEKIYLADYKTTEASAEAGSVSRRVGDMGYDIQMAFYRFILRQLIEDCPEIECFVISQELSQPYAISVVRLSHEYMTLGSKVAMEAMSRWKHHITTDNWPGYPPLIGNAQPPSFIENNRLESESIRAMTSPYEQAFYDIASRPNDEAADEARAKTVMA